MVKKFLHFLGSLDSTYSYGTNKLIKNGAYLVMEAEDIFEQFPEFFLRKRKNIEKNKSYGNSEFGNIYNILSDSPKSIDEIVLKTKMSVVEVMQKLTLMELEDMVIQEIGKGFKIKKE